MDARSSHLDFAPRPSNTPKRCWRRTKCCKNFTTVACSTSCAALGASDAIVEIAVSATNTPESIRALRNLLLLAQALGALEPAVLADFTRAVPAALAQASAEEARPPGLLKLLSTFFKKDFRRGLAAMNDLVVAFGRNLSSVEKR